MASTILTTRVKLGNYLLLLLFLHVNWLGYHITMTNWVNLLIVFHKKPLRVNTAIMNYVLCPSIMFVYVS